MLIVYYRIDELVTLQYGNFLILTKWVREFMEEQLLKLSSQKNPPKPFVLK